MLGDVVEEDLETAAEGCQGLIVVAWSLRGFQNSDGRTYVNSTVIFIFEVVDSEALDAMMPAGNLDSADWLVLRKHFS